MTSMGDFKFGVEIWCWCCNNTNTGQNTELEMRPGVEVDLKIYDAVPVVRVEAGVEYRLLNRAPWLVLVICV